MTEEKWPRVGTGVWVVRNGKVLLGYRTWKHAPNTWSPPGGKLELYETPEVCAVRETLEETGIKVENVRFITFTNDVYEEVQQHYITLHFVADWKSGEATLTEPEKFAEWRWCEWGKLPEPLLRSAKNFVDLGMNPLELIGLKG